MSRRSNHSPVLDALGVPADTGSIYELALTHRSFAFEQPEPEQNNERLELLGDAILDAIVTDFIYRSYPDLAEGEMARLRASVVNTNALAELARAIGLGDHIRLGKGEEGSGGRTKPSLLADTFEALVGAAYLEQGLETLSATLVPVFAERLDEIVAGGGAFDAKTILQELTVRDNGARPSYRVESSGPDHDKRFTATVLIGNEPYGQGTGRSKKDAEQKAARGALDRLQAEGRGPEQHTVAAARAQSKEEVDV